MLYVLYVKEPRLIVPSCPANMLHKENREYYRFGEYDTAREAYHAHKENFGGRPVSYIVEEEAESLDPFGAQFLLAMRSDKKKSPDFFRFRMLTVDELRRNVPRSAFIKDQQGRAAEVKINGAAKWWKTRPRDVRIPWKFGMYEYGEFLMEDGKWVSGKEMLVRETN